MAFTWGLCSQQLFRVPVQWSTRYRHDLYRKNTILIAANVEGWFFPNMS
jgi:hypothetical protein